MMGFDLQNIINKFAEIFNNILGYIYDEHPFLGLVANIVTIGTPILLFVKWLWPKLREKETFCKLGEIDDDYTVNLVKSRRYIPTMGQDEPPHENDKVKIDPERFPLIEHILNEILNKNQSGIKRFMILGGSGMGKSTFSAALYYHLYHKKNLKNQYNIYIKSLSSVNVLDALNKLNELNSAETKKSVIILDALDENIEAAKDVSEFIDKLEKATSKFNFVIITCRTQFFDDKNSEPNELRIRREWGVVRKLNYDKIYVSPFTEKEAKKYLRRKYGFISRKYRKAVKIVTQECWDVFSRPMILSFIDDLMELEDTSVITPIEIYSKIIDKWFDHEIEIQDIDKNDLFSFSKRIALFMYKKREESESAVISDEEYKHFIKDSCFDKSPYSFKARSLINRRSDGAIKFSHKSIWEFFLAIISYENPGQPFINNGFDMAIRFVDDISYLYTIGKCLDFVQYNCKRSTALNQIITKDSKRQLLHELADYRTGLMSIMNLTYSDDLCWYYRVLNQILEIAIKIIYEYDQSVKMQDVFLQNKSLIDKFLVGPKIDYDDPGVLYYAISLIHSIQESFELNDILLLRQDVKYLLDNNKIDFLIRNTFLHEHFIYPEDILKSSAYPFKKDKKQPQIEYRYPFFADNKTANSGIRVIGSGFNSEYEIKSFLINSHGILVILRDSNDIEEITDYIDWFKSVFSEGGIVLLNIKYEKLFVNYIIDSETVNCEKRKIKSRLLNMIKGVKSDTNRYTWYFKQ